MNDDLGLACRSPEYGCSSTDADCPLTTSGQAVGRTTLDALRSDSVAKSLICLGRRVISMKKAVLVLHGVTRSFLTEDLPEVCLADAGRRSAA